MANVANLYHAYGVRNNLKNLIIFVDDTTVAYPVGSHIVVHNLETSVQKFISLADNGNNLTCLAVGRSQYLAYGERSDPFAALIVYDLSTFRKKRTMVTSELNCNSYMALDFVDSGRYIAGVSGPPEYNLVYWFWEKSRLLGVARIGTEVKQMKICPKNSSRLAVCGPRMVKTYRIDADSQLQLDPKSSAKINEFFDFVSLAWISENRMLLGTSQRQIIIWEDGSLIRDIMDPSASLSLHSTKAFKKGENMEAFDNIVIYSTGFICVSGPGTLKNFNLSNGTYSFHKDIRIILEDRVLEYGILDEQQILDIAISPTGDLVAIVTERRQIFAAKVRELRKSQDEYYKMKPLLYSMHSSSVSGTDICVRKPLVVTCAADRTIRIWNFYNRDCEIWKKFPEEPHSVAIHPSGLYLLAGFTDKLKMMHILNDDIKTVRELPIRGCREVRFAHGGHLFGAANGAIIQVYTTVQFENTLNLKGHTSRIRSILWSNNDIRMFTSSQDGSLLEWDLLTGDIIHEVTLRGSIFTSLAVAPDGETVYAVTSDGIVKEIVNGQTTRDLSCPGSVLTSVNLSCVAHALFFGTTEGVLKTVTYPLISEGLELLWKDTPAHQQEITRTILSYDEQLLISTSTDGNVFVWEVMEGELAKVLRRDKPSPYSDEILIEKKDLDAKNAEITDLVTKAHETQLENEYQRRAKDSLHSEKMKDITDSFTKEIELLKKRNEKLAMEKDQSDQQHQQDMAIMIEKFNHDLLEQEKTTNQKLLLEYEKYAELILEKEKQESEFKEQLQEVAASKENAIERLTAHYETKIESLHTILDKTQKEFADYMREHDELRHMIEEDADMEISDIRARYETAIFELKDINMRLKGENVVTKKKINNLLKDIDDHKAEVMKYQEDLNKQLGVATGLEKEIESWKKELKEREENVQDKDKRIHELKKKNQELEKFKFVLDFKIKELRKQMEPKDNEISDMNKQIKEMKTLTEVLNGKITQMEKDGKVLENTLSITRKDRDQASRLLKQREHFLRRFQGEMELAMDQIENPDKLKELFLAVCSKYVRSTTKKYQVTAEEESSLREKVLAREVEELQHVISNTKSQYQSKTNVLSRKLWKMMQQNTNLIEEVNFFRQEITRLKTRIHMLDLALQGTNPRRKDDYAKIQALLKEVESARLSELEKAGVIDLYQQELRRLHLLLVLMREVVNNQSNPGIAEMVSRLHDVQLPPVVDQSKLNLVEETIAIKVTRFMDDLKENLPGAPLPKIERVDKSTTEQSTKSEARESDPEKKFSFPKPDKKAETPLRQLQFLKNHLNSDSVQPTEEIPASSELSTTDNTIREPSTSQL